MHALEREQVGDLLEGDLLGDASGDGMFSGGIPSGGGGGSSVGGADLLGFDANPGPPPATDVFGGASSSSGMANDFGADLLGFDGPTGGNTNALNSGGAFSPQAAANSTISGGRNPVMPGYMGGRTNDIGNNNVSNNALNNGAGIMGTNDGFDLRPSVLTGARGDATVGGPLHSQRPPPTASDFAGVDCDISSMGAMGGARGTGAPGGAKGALRPDLSEEAQMENSRKMHMAAGLFAGVVLSDARGTRSQKKSIMAMGNNSKISALDDLIPVTNTALSSPPTSNDLAFGVNDLTSAMSSSDPFGMRPMGGNAANTTIHPAHAPAPAPSMAPPPPSASDPFGMGPMGGTIGDNATIPTAAPPMAPPPPPMEPPPPVPSVDPPPPPPSTTMSPAMALAMTPPNPNNIMGSNNNNNNASVEEMQEMIKQQQAQMAQMMQMMQHMQMQGGGGLNNKGANNGAGGWP